MVEEEEGLDALERLQENKSEKVYSLAFRIISEFFGDEDENTDQNTDVTQPSTAPYNF